MQLMQLIYQFRWKIWLIAIFSFLIMDNHAFAQQSEEMKAIPSWDMMWGQPGDRIEDLIFSPASGKWMTFTSNDEMLDKPADITTAWIRIKLPMQIPKDSGLYIDDMYTQQASIYIGDRLVRNVKFDFPYDEQRTLLPLSTEDAGNFVYLKLQTSMERLGIHSEIRLDHYAELTRAFIFRDLQNIILGCAFLFISVIMLICSFFLKQVQRSTWISLCLIILTLGMIFLTYSPFLYANFTQFGSIFVDLFDVSLAVFLPSLTYFYEKVFDNGHFKWIRNFRKFQMVYSSISIIFMLFNQLNHYRFVQPYLFFTVTILGIIMIFQFIVIIVLSILFVIRGNKEAVIFSYGFGSFALMGVFDLILYFANNQKYQFFLWKIGVVGFIIALIVILGRRFAINQEQMSNYSKELEFYNHQLQLSEKMEMISSLAASVAHEVRNPLQVTRGFLQLVAARTDDKNKEYMGIAIEELDRASVIITDFLTFAKPQLDELVSLNVSKEISQIEGIIMPLATLNGGHIYVSIPTDLHILGNSSKLKQVLINIIKNSIEAFQVDGQIHIWAYEKNEEVFIHIKDNGEGIEPLQLARLGEPYYSTKTKGTGLGLMVTFRLVEIMKGQIEFKSQKFVGTEVIMKFPLFTEK
ncbi:HAMP domain-containing sensor histidine kinase [Paenibacillus roseipurpureus]|uniref:histidine kinase n=1 Tax=Paenibacillus roseopurpureus TaxID=2918901 RepID=A0AA96LMS8_9BACL|nr:HAMP domain-containing sensor histidine kinase [Paenibacillus sp. MBLB1832]WNR43421.1 HAMP domain-containing sensor histidine kinase [Paenibacillus sp. MBLB1832]